MKKKHPPMKSFTTKRGTGLHRIFDAKLESVIHDNLQRTAQFLNHPTVQKDLLKCQVSYDLLHL